MNNYQNDYETLISVKIVQKTAVLQHHMINHPKILENLKYNNFPVPAKRSFSNANMEKYITISEDESTSCSMKEESIETPKKEQCMQNEQFVHYSNILPAHDKRQEAINTLIAIFHTRLIENSYMEECQVFRSNLYKVLEAMALHWSDLKCQNGEALACATLLIVCMISNIKQILVLDSIKESNLNQIAKLSCIKKTRAYIIISKILNKK